MKKSLLEEIEFILKHYSPEKFKNKKFNNKDSSWEYFDDISFRKSSVEVKRNLDKFIEFENSVSIVGSGVYVIENFYVGKTNNIVNRIVSHILECFYEEYGCKNSFNKEKSYKIKEVLKTRKLRVKLIDSEQNRESIYINELKEKFLLTNIVGVKTSKKFTKNELKEYKKILKIITENINKIN